MEYNKNEQKFRKIGLIYLIFIIFFIFIAFLPNYFDAYDYRSIFFVGGWQGLFFILLSMLFTRWVKVKIAIVSGVIGCICIGINLGIFSIHQIPGNSQYSLCLFNLLGFSGVTISLYLSKSMEFKETSIRKVIQEKNKQKIRKIGLIHLIFIIILIIPVFLQFESLTKDPLEQQLFFAQTYVIGFPFIFLSILFAVLLRVNEAIISGLLGCIIIGINLFRFIGSIVIIITIYISIIGFCWVTVGLYKFRPMEEEIKEVPIELQAITPMKKEIKEVPIELQILPEQQQEQLHQQRFEKLKKIVRVSKRLEVSRMAEVLKMKESDLWDLIFDWADEFNFKINKDLVEFNVEKTDDFIAKLDAEFSKWENSSEKI